MDVEIHKWCDELGLKGKEATKFIELHKFDIDVYEYIQLCKELEMENDDIIELFLISAEIRRIRCGTYYDRLREVSEREAAAEKFERKYKLLENEFLSKIEETPNPIIEVISTEKSSTPESVSLENNVIEIENPTTLSQVLPMKGENFFSQPQSSAEREELPSQDLPILSASSKWENNEDEISSLYKTSAEQDEEEENLVTSDVIKRTENVLFSKDLSNRSSISHKVYIEKNKEKKIERSRTPTPEWGKVDIREAKKKGSSTQIAISSKTESQAGRLRMKELKQEFKSEVEFSAFEGRSIMEVNQEEYKYTLHIAKMKHDSSCHEQEAVKLIQLNCEKEFCIECLHTEHQSLPDIQMDSLISLLQDEETEAESSNYLILPSPLSYSSFSPNDDLTNEVERKKRRKRKLCERKRMGNGDNNSDKRKNLNCKYVTRITGKSSTFQIQQTRLYKYRRK
ncbi:UNVERIFIED_CONTAM: hypothetical protein RMT77_018716 [Armadillidium vulgare]